jgi:hypothetical protein
MLGDSCNLPLGKCRKIRLSASLLSLSTMLCDVNIEDYSSAVVVFRNGEPNNKRIKRIFFFCSAMLEWSRVENYNKVVDLQSTRE